MNLPPIFIERTKAILKEEYPAFENALQQLAPTSIRINDKMDYMPSAEKVAWCDKGYYLNERPLFTADPLFHAGVYYVQEASSMFPHCTKNTDFYRSKKFRPTTDLFTIFRD